MDAKPIVISKIKHYITIAASSNVPAEPETVPIPPGTVRRFHVTSAKNKQSILQHGLTFSHATGIEGPKAVYSWPTWKDAVEYQGTHKGAIVVEFYDNPRHYDSHPYASFYTVPPEHIIAIHEHWHPVYRYVKENNVPLKNLKRAADGINDPDDHYVRTLREIEHESGHNDDDDDNDDGFRKYRRVQIAELRPYIEGETLDPKVSISAADKANGSPKPGDMIARNPKNHDDQWLVAKKYFLDNFVAVE